MQPQIDLNEIVKEFKAVDFTSLVLSTGLLYNLVLVSILLHAGEDTGTTYTVGTSGTAKDERRDRPPSH